MELLSSWVYFNNILNYFTYSPRVQLDWTLDWQLYSLKHPVLVCIIFIYNIISMCYCFIFMFIIDAIYLYYMYVNYMIIDDLYTWEGTWVMFEIYREKWKRMSLFVSNMLTLIFLSLLLCVTYYSLLFEHDLQVIIHI